MHVNGAPGPHDLITAQFPYAKWFLLLVACLDQVLHVRLGARERNRLVRDRHSFCGTLSNLAREFGISPQRVWQIAGGN